MKRLHWNLLVMVSIAIFSVAGCGDEITEVEYFGDFGLDTDFDKADGMGTAAVPVSADSSNTAVWEVHNNWTDRDPEAGLAWSANSGLNWNEKYAHWVKSMPKIDTHDSRYKTFEITNPQGKVLQAPVLECAEVAYFLRATFASWYNLPFFLQAVDSSGTRVYMGHFGWRTAEGRYKNSNKFKDWYRDYSNGSYSAINWPQDSKLRGKKLYGSNDDFQPFIGPDARAGAYFDELFLNKRVGHFLILMLSNFGSIHLADSANTFNLQPAALREGDVLLERWQRRGIGHTLVVKSVEPGLTEGKLVSELVSGSMPRRQPKWEDDIASKRYFTMEETGGEGSNYQGEEYAKLGGGIKRWRVAVAKSGYYVNTIMDEDVPNWISNTNYPAIAARPGQFEDLLEEVEPEAKRDAIAAIIEDKRDHLRQYPASCSARINREKAFDELYELMAQSPFWQNTEQVDRQYRKFEDYVFAELVYEESKTCCWNSTTSAMYEIVMDYNLAYVREGGGCRNPVVFMNDGGYGTFADHAASLGRGGEWVAWSEDEPCSQRNVASDSEEQHSWTSFCSIIDDILPADACENDGDCADSQACTADTCLADGSCGHQPDDNLCPAGQTCDPDQGCTGGGCADDGFEENDSDSQAAAVSGDQSDLMICSGDDDWYLLHSNAGTLTAAIHFTHSDGDLDLEITDASGTAIDSSTSTGDSETVEVSVSAEGDFLLRVYGYNGAQTGYDLTVNLP